MATDTTPGYVSNSSLAATLSALADKWNTYKNALRDLLTKPTGTVDMEDGTGTIVTLPTFPQLQADVNAMTDAASGAVAGSQASASAANASAAQSQDSADQSAESAAAALASQVAAKASEDSSAAHEGATATSASLADAAASRASAQADAATEQANASSASAGAAAASASLAGDKAAEAGDSATAASGSAAEAQSWALTAQTTVTGLLHYMGAWDASGGAFPDSPTKGAFWKISGTGTVGGTDLAVGDQIIYSGTGWDKIDNTESVTSVAGRVGAVVLSWDDIGGKPSSFAPSPHTHAIEDVTGLQGALDAKASLNSSPSFSGSVTAGQTFQSYTAALVLGTTGAGSVYIRPGGSAATAGQLVVSTGGVTWDTNNVWHAGNLNPATKVSTGPGYSPGNDANNVNNNANGSGFWGFSSGALNTPYNDWATVMHAAPWGDGQRAFQISYSWNHGDFQIRFIGGAWNVLLHSGNSSMVRVQSADPGGVPDGTLWVW